MTTKIPHTEYTQITQTKSSPKTIVALLNEAEEKHSPTPKHWNAKRIYPFWKTCQDCSNPFQCQTKEQVSRNKWCKDCHTKNMGQWNKGKKQTKQECIVCETMFYPTGQSKNKPRKVCSRECNGVLRGEEWKQHAHKGRAAWTEESEKELVERMTGDTNPSWKGGVTYFKKKGNYKDIKHVRCPGAFMEMARKDGYVMEHRLVVAQAIGRPLTRTEVVHHVNHDPQDNRLENLELFANNRDHKLYEHHGTPQPIWRMSSQSTTKE
jgi:hypothetical protein